VFKNKKMAGHMGAVRVTTQNLTVIGVDAERGLITIKGSVPGFEDNYLLVRDAVKAIQSKDLPFPAAIKSAAQAPAAQEPAATEAPVEAVETPQDGE
jgi:large subunit ribosomal protein L3